MAAILESKQTYAIESGGAITEGLGGIAVIVLAILALVGVMPFVLAPVAGIVFGAAFIVEGAAVAARYSALARATAQDRGEQIELGAGVSVEIAVGAAAVVLAILAVIGIAPAVLMASLVIAGGAGLILSAGALDRLKDARVFDGTMPSRPSSLTRQAMMGAEGTQVLAGIGAGALGIIALTNLASPAAPVLVQVGLLTLGVALTFAGSALSSRMLTLFNRS